MRPDCKNCIESTSGFCKEHLPNYPLSHKTWEEGCVFCNIANRAVVDIIDIEPLNPVVKGHRIVFANRHSTDFADDIELTMRVMQYASQLANKLGGEFNLITSKGKNATQSVFHLHVHLVPRNENDGLLLPWTDISSLLADTERKVLEDVWELIKETDGARTYRSVEIINNFLRHAKSKGLSLKDTKE